MEPSGSDGNGQQRQGQMMDMLRGMRDERRIPFVIQGINVGGLVLLGLLLVPAAVVRLDQLLVVLPVFVLLIAVYWVFRNNTTASALYFTLSITLGLWIILCENIVFIDNLLGSHITGELSLGIRLQDFAKTHLKDQTQFRQGCCGDPLSFNYKPGSLYKRTYDCPQCNERYEVVVDATGYLNRPQELADNGRHIDMFIAGDSVLQGYGTPSIVESLNRLLPARIWNLSITRYGPRQKVNALITYALPRHPQWIIVEFYAGNDINDTIIDESCEGSGNFYCLFNPSERRRRVLGHPVFSSMVDTSKDTVGVFEDYSENSFTLAVTTYLLSNIKGRVKEAVSPSRGRTIIDADAKGKNPDKAGKARLSASDITVPGFADFNVSQVRKFDWLKEGMRLTYRRYDRLAEEIGKMEHPPIVILLYNPSAYEIYRDVKVGRDGEADRVSDFQRQALKEYAEKTDWRLLDLTESLNAEVERSGVWVYGESDTIHWSAQGGDLVASVLARELAPLTRGSKEVPSVTADSTASLKMSSDMGAPQARQGPNGSLMACM